MCMYDYDQPEFSWSKDVVARKEHKCCECGRVILKGERYEYYAGSWDGNFDIFKTCQHCVVAKDWLTEACGGYLFSGVLEDLEEHFHEGYTSVGRLCVGMRRKWQNRFGYLMSLPI